VKGFLLVILEDAEHTTAPFSHVFSGNLEY